MIAELFIIIGIAIMVAISIKKLPIMTSADIESGRIKNVDTKKENIFEKIKLWWQLVIAQIKDFFEKRKKKSSAGVAYKEKTDSLRGNTIFPQENNTTEKEENSSVSPSFNSGPAGNFWNEQHKVGNKPLISATVGSAFLQAENLFETKKFKEAEDLYIKAASEDPENHKIFNRLGAIYMEQKNYSDAVEAFRAAVKIDAGIASRHYNLAVALMAKGDQISAKKSLHTALDLEPTNVKYRHTLEDLG